MCQKHGSQKQDGRLTKFVEDSRRFFSWQFSKGDTDALKFLVVS